MHSGSKSSFLLSDTESDSGAWEKVADLEAGAQSVGEMWPCLSSAHSSSYIPQWWLAQTSLLDKGVWSDWIRSSAIASYIPGFGAMEASEQWLKLATKEWIQKLNEDNQPPFMWLTAESHWLRAKQCPKAMQAVLRSGPSLLRAGSWPKTILPLKSVHTPLLISINDFTLL